LGNSEPDEGGSWAAVLWVEAGDDVEETHPTLILWDARTGNAKRMLFRMISSRYFTAFPERTDIIGRLARLWRPRS
jgi:hypothetical protein